MKSITRLFSLALSLLLLALPAQAVPTLTLSTPDASVPVGGQINIALDISGIEDLYGFNVTIGYNPSRVGFLGVTEGSFLSNVNTTYFIPGVDDGSGSVAFSGAALIGEIGGASGSGNLLNFVFTGLNPGVALFTLSDLLFIDSAFGEIGVDGATLRVVVEGEPVDVPEPAGLALMVAGALALAARRGRGKGCLR